MSGWLIVLQEQVSVDAGTKAKRWLNGALFPVSAGAVVAEIATLLAVFLNFSTASHIGGWAGASAAIIALGFQAYPRNR
jgi:uncharacterized membrane protein YebE (DUF533 family)